MTSKVLGFCSVKGGSGQTTLAVHAALYLAKKTAGVKRAAICFVDMSVTGDASRYLTKGSLPLHGSNEGASECSVLFRDGGRLLPYQASPALDMPIDLFWADRVTTSINSKMHTEEVQAALVRNLSELTDRYDVVILDLPSCGTGMFRASAKLCTHLIGVHGDCGLGRSSASLLGAVLSEFSAGSELRVANNMVPTRTDNPVNGSHVFSGIEVLSDPMHRRQQVESAAQAHLPIWQLTSGSSKPASKEFKVFCDAVWRFLTT